MFTSIVTGTDGSPTADEAMRQAVELAKRFGAHVHLVNVSRPMGTVIATPEAAHLAPLAAEWESEQRESLGTVLEATAARLTAEGVQVTTHLATGDPSEVIMRVAEDMKADLIVVGNRGMRGARRYLGSVPNTISHKAPCSVLIVRTT